MQSNPHRKLHRACRAERSTCVVTHTSPRTAEWRHIVCHCDVWREQQPVVLCRCHSRAACNPQTNKQAISNALHHIQHHHNNKMRRHKEETPYERNRTWTIGISGARQASQVPVQIVVARVAGRTKERHSALAHSTRAEAQQRLMPSSAPAARLRQPLCPGRQ